MNDTKRTSDREKSTPPSDPSRRSFLGRLWWVLGGVAVAEYLVVALDFVRPHGQEPGEGERHIFIAGPIGEFEPGTVTAFPSGKLYLARMKDGGFLALSRTCTHLGCTVPWDPAKGRFVCPCHASAFDITGQVLSAPASRPLDRYAVRIENGVVKIDTSKALKRHSFDPTQPTYA